MNYFDMERYIDKFGINEEGVYLDTATFPRREGMLTGGGEFSEYMHIEAPGVVYEDTGLYVMDGGCDIFSTRHVFDDEVEYRPYVMALQATVLPSDFENLRHFFDPEIGEHFRQGYISRINMARPGVIYIPDIGFSLGADEKPQATINFDGSIYSCHSGKVLSLSLVPENGEVLFERDEKIFYEQTKPSIIHTTQTIQNSEMLKFVIGLEYDPYRLDEIPEILEDSPYDPSWYTQVREIINPYLRTEIIQKKKV